MIIDGTNFPATGMTTPDPAGEIEIVSVLSQYVYIGPYQQPYTPGTISSGNLTPQYDGENDPNPF